MSARTISCSTLESKLPNRYHTCDLFSVVRSVTMQWTSSVDCSNFRALSTHSTLASILSRDLNSLLLYVKVMTVWHGGCLQVMLMSGLTAEAFAEIVSEKSMEDKPTHLHNLLKFVALRKDRSAIMAAGGIWDQDLDGGNPATDDSALIRTAIRFTNHPIVSCSFVLLCCCPVS